MQKIALTLCLIFIPLLTLTACGDLYEEGHVTGNRMQVHPEQYASRQPLATASDEYLEGVIADFKRSGSDTMDVTVTYDPRTAGNSAARAGNDLARVRRQLESQGVKNINGSVMPVQGDSEPQLLVTFNGYAASPPEDCKVMQGFDDRIQTTDETYKLGCTMDTVMSKQVAHPRDLVGDKPLDPTSDGRRGANIVERYRAGTPNQALSGESASGE